MAYETYKSPCPHTYHLQAGSSQSNCPAPGRSKLGCCCRSGQINLISYRATAQLQPRAAHNMALPRQLVFPPPLTRLPLPQKGNRKGTNRMAGLTSPVGCHIDYTDLHLLLATVLSLWLSAILLTLCCYYPRGAIRNRDHPAINSLSKTTIFSILD